MVQQGRIPSSARVTTTVIRLSPEVHRAARQLALDRGTTMNAELSKAVEEYLERELQRGKTVAGAQ